MPPALNLRIQTTESLLDSAFRMLWVASKKSRLPSVTILREMEQRFEAAKLSEQTNRKTPNNPTP